MNVEWSLNDWYVVGKFDLVNLRIIYTKPLHAFLLITCPIMKQPNLNTLQDTFETDHLVAWDAGLQGKCKYSK